MSRRPMSMKRHITQEALELRDEQMTAKGLCIESDDAWTLANFNVFNDSASGWTYIGLRHDLRVTFETQYGHSGSGYIVGCQGVHFMCTSHLVKQEAVCDRKI